MALRKISTKVIDGDFGGGGDNVLDRVDIPASLILDFTSRSGAPFADCHTRATGGGYARRPNGLYVPTGINEPVIDYGADGKPKGTGFFGAYTNLLTYSEQFDNAAWTKVNATITADASSSPTGFVTAEKLVENTSSGVHGIQQNFAVEASSSYCISVFAKDGGAGRMLRVAVSGVSNWTEGFEARFNLTSGTVYGSSANAKASIMSIGGGWYLCSVIMTTVASPPGGAGATIQMTDGSGAFSYTGDGTSGLFIFGAQSTKTAFPVPYVPTTSAAVTRNADAFLLSGSDFTDFWNPSEGTYFVDSDIPLGAVGSRRIIEINDNTSNNRIFIYHNTLAEEIQGRLTVGGVVQSEVGRPATPGAAMRMAYSLKKDAFNFAANGMSGIADTSGAMPVGINRMIIYAELNGYIRRLIYWPKALTATKLQEITT